MSDFRGSKRGGLQVSPLVEALLKDPNAPPDTVILTGFVGKSTTANRLRLYTSAQLDNCIEFDQADVLHSASVGENGFPVTIVWLKRDARVQNISFSSAESAFFQGDIASSMLPGSVGGVGDAELIGTIIRTVSRLLCSRVCPSRRWCPDTNMTWCNPASCILCNSPR